MTSMNIGLLAATFCVLWALEGALRADPLGLCLSAAKEEHEAESTEVVTLTDTLLQTGLAGERGEVEIQGGEVSSLEDYLPEISPYDLPYPRIRATSPVGLGGLLSPFQPGGESLYDPTFGDLSNQNVSARLPFLNQTRQGRMAQHLGPLGLDIYAITFTALYSDLQLRKVHSENDGGFLAALSLNGALTLALDESAYLGVGFTLYYLPTNNRVGFFFGNGGDTSVVFRSESDYGRWHFVIADDFRVYQPLSDILREYEVDEIATAGRYRFGRADNSLGNRAFFSEDLYFINVASVSASTQIDDSWQFRGRLSHGTVWAHSSFEPYSDQDRASALFTYQPTDKAYRAWLEYDFYRLQSEVTSADVRVHEAVVGASLPFTPTLTMFSRTGWVVYDEDHFKRDHYLLEAGFTHHASIEFSHSLFGGYNYAITDIGDSFSGSYWRYTAEFQPEGSRWRFSGTVQQNFNDVSDTRGTVYVGRSSCAFTERDVLNFVATKAYYIRGVSRYDRQVLGVSLNHAFSPSISGVLSFQYNHYRSPNQLYVYDERLFNLYITKSF